MSSFFFPEDIRVRRLLGVYTFVYHALMLPRNLIEEVEQTVNLQDMIEFWILEWEDRFGQDYCTQPLTGMHSAMPIKPGRRTAHCTSALPRGLRTCTAYPRGCTNIRPGTMGLGKQTLEGLLSHLQGVGVGVGWAGSRV